MFVGGAFGFHLPNSQFKRKRIFLVDYHLLEEVKRVAESAQRKRAKLCDILNLRFHIVFEALRMLREVEGRNSYFSC